MKQLSKLLEWIRPAGVFLVYFMASYLGTDAISKFHILGPFMVMLMSGTVAFESLIIGEAASEKIGYKPNRAYQVQSGLNYLAMALTALLVFLLDWGAMRMQPLPLPCWCAFLYRQQTMWQQQSGSITSSRSM